MKQKTRSAAALVSTSLLAGGGIAAAVTGFGQPAPVPATTTASAPSSDAALGAAVHELLSRSRQLHGRLTSTRHELHVLDRRLHHQQALAQHIAAAPPPAPAVRPQATTPLPPSVHTTTRASTSTGAAPKVHTTTRASTSTGAAPKVHTTTRASGAGGPGVHTTTRASAVGGEHEGGGDD